LLNYQEVHDSSPFKSAHDLSAIQQPNFLPQHGDDSFLSDQEEQDYSDFNRIDKLKQILQEILVSAQHHELISPHDFESCQLKLEGALDRLEKMEGHEEQTDNAGAFIVQQSLSDLAQTVQSNFQNAGQPQAGFEGFIKKV
jgi:hypothetical protein